MAFFKSSKGVNYFNCFYLTGKCNSVAGVFYELTERAAQQLFFLYKLISIFSVIFFLRGNSSSCCFERNGWRRKRRCGDNISYPRFLDIYSSCIACHQKEKGFDKKSVPYFECG